MGTSVRDTDWIRQSFLLPRDSISEQDQIRRYLTDAQFKFVDTTLGGNFAINPPPQFTSYADIRVPGRRAESEGLGRYYSESLDDHGQYIQMQFGVPQYNSLSNFFINFYNPKASLMARTGRTSSLFYDVGRAIGFVVTLPAKPFIWMGSVYRFIMNKPVSRYYYLKPTMALYWDAVNTIANAIGVNMGIIPNGISGEEEMMRGEGPGFSDAEMTLFHNAIPDIYRKEGGIDVYALANRAKRLENQARENIKNHVISATSAQNLAERIQQFQSETVVDSGGGDFREYIKSYMAQEKVQPGELGEEDGESTGTNFNGWDTYAEFAEAEWQDGSAWITLRVDNTDTASESFSNTVGESEIATKMNNMSGQARSTRFSLAEGNVTGGLFDSAIQAVGDVVSGVSEQLMVSGLAALAGSAFADIPKTWQGSTAELPTSTYTIELRSPYGTPLSRFTNLMVPLAMILAGALPIATGKQSYTSPFICSIFSKGRSQARLGMITSLSITRGTGNVGWTRDHAPLGIDVSFTVTDMSTVMHMPLKSAMSTLDAVTAASLGVAGGAASVVGGSTYAEGAELAEKVSLAAQSATYDDDNAFTDYMAVLGSLSMHDQVYSDNKWRLSMARRYAELQSFKSPAKTASWVMGNHSTEWLKKVAIFTGANDI